MFLGYSSNFSTILFIINKNIKLFFFCWKKINFLVINVMDLLVDSIIEKISEVGHEPKRFKIIRLKTISSNIHAVIVDVKMNNQKC